MDRELIVQFFQALNLSRLPRIQVIQVNVAAHKFSYVCLFFHDYGFVSILKKTAASGMPQAAALGAAGHFRRIIWEGCRSQRRIAGKIMPRFN